MSSQFLAVLLDVSLHVTRIGFVLDSLFTLAKGWSYPPQNAVETTYFLHISESSCWTQRDHVFQQEISTSLLVERLGLVLRATSNIGVPMANPHQTCFWMTDTDTVRTDPHQN